MDANLPPPPKPPRSPKADRAAARSDVSGSVSSVGSATSVAPVPAPRRRSNKSPSPPPTPSPRSCSISNAAHDDLDLDMLPLPRESMLVSVDEAEAALTGAVGGAAITVRKAPPPAPPSPLTGVEESGAATSADLLPPPAAPAPSDVTSVQAAPDPTNVLPPPPRVVVPPHGKGGGEKEEFKEGEGRENEAAASSAASASSPTSAPVEPTPATVEETEKKKKKKKKAPPAPPPRGSSLKPPPPPPSSSSSPSHSPSAHPVPPAPAAATAAAPNLCTGTSPQPAADAAPERVDAAGGETTEEQATPTPKAEAEAGAKAAAMTAATPSAVPPVPTRLPPLPHVPPPQEPPAKHITGAGSNGGGKDDEDKLTMAPSPPVPPVPPASRAATAAVDAVPITPPAGLKMVLPPPPPPPSVAPHPSTTQSNAHLKRPPPLAATVANLVMPPPPPPPGTTAATEGAAGAGKGKEDACKPARRVTLSVDGGAELGTASATEPASPLLASPSGMRPSTSASSVASGVSFTIPPPPPQSNSSGSGGIGKETADTERGLAPVRKGLVNNAADPSARPELLFCSLVYADVRNSYMTYVIYTEGEGYLDKLKSNMMRNRNRHFRLTEAVFAYHENNGGPCINVYKKSDLHSVEDEGGSKFSVVFSTLAKDDVDDVDDGEEGANGGGGGGGSRATKRILLQAPNARVKGKWMRFLTLDLTRRGGGSEQLVVEGGLGVARAAFTSNGQRWVRVTERLIEINKDEEGEILYSILLTAVQYVDVTKDKREIKVDIAKPGADAGETMSFLLKAKNEREKNKWAATFQRVFPQEKLGTELEMCPYMESY